MKVDYVKKIGSVMRSEACVVEMNLFGGDGKYIRHKLLKDNPLPYYMMNIGKSDEDFKKFYYRAVCKRCGMVSFIKPKEYFLWRPKE
jgi:hypothetical protein